MKLDTEKVQPASLLSRFVAAAIDFGLVVILSIFSSMIVYSIVQNSKTKLADTLELETQNISSSHLGKLDKGQYKSYTSDEYFAKTENGYQIIDSLSYFYTIYLAGDEAKASTGDIVAINAKDNMTIDGVTTTPSEYYTVDWFNVNILGLPKGEQVAKYDYFVYQKNGDENDYTKMGTINEKYITETDGAISVNASDEMIEYTYNTYKAAVTLFYAQDYMVGYQNYVDSVNNLIVFICRISFAFIIFEILPLSLVRGKTLGKLLMRMSLVRPNNDSIARWQVIPRGLLILAVPVVLYLIKNLGIQIAIIGVLLVVSIVLFFVNKNSRMVLHDLISQTVVIEDPEKPKAN